MSGSPSTPAAAPRLRALVAELKPAYLVCGDDDAKIDAWHANSAGSYYFASWTLRGTATADAQGRLELLTVRPGDYAGRSAHVHMRIAGPTKGRRTVPLTTQAYVLRGNDPRYLGRDVLCVFESSCRRGL